MSEAASRDITLQFVNQIQENEKLQALNKKQADDLTHLGYTIIKHESIVEKFEDQICDLKNDLNRAENELHEKTKELDYYKDKSRALDFEVRRLKEENS
jgi:hypothetical protein